MINSTNRFVKITSIIKTPTISFSSLLRYTLLSVLVSLIVLIQVHSQPSTKGKSGSSISAETATAALMNINRISMWVNDNGILEKNSSTQSAGVTYPRGTSTLVFDGGLLWGGMVHDGGSTVLRVGGQARVSGTIPGRISSLRLPENRFDGNVRVFRIRKDWKTADLTQDASESYGISIYDVTTNHIQALRQQYTEDWLEWPWQKGAPYYERNGIPGYQADTSSFEGLKDEPGLLHADEVIWLVCNDLNPSTTSLLAGSPPIGIEQQITCWAYSSDNELGNVIFQKHKIIYKGSTTTPPNSHIDSMYLAKWADTDIGEVNDDFSGCSVDMNLGFSYNATDIDYEYDKFGILAPVVGYDLLQGPRISSVGGSAHWNFSTISGYANLPMTSFIALVDSELHDQPLRNNYAGTRQWWNLMRGFHSNPITPEQCFVDPFTERCTPYSLPGDPRYYEGWVDGNVAPKGDRRILLSSGPFQMALGDTQEVVIALIAAGGKSRIERFNALDSIDAAAEKLFSNNFQQPDTIPQPDLRIVELDKTFILDWETNASRSDSIDSYNSQGYKFETYKIYQFSDTLPTSTHVQFPPFDPESPRSLHITTDLLRNKPLANGQRYYYAVTSVMYNPDATNGKKRIESRLTIHTVKPHAPNPGVVYSYDIGDTIRNVYNYVGFNDAPVKVDIYDPSKANGDSLKILFHFPPPYDDKVKWDIINTRTGDTLLKNIVIGSPAQRVISAGLNVKVDRQLNGLKGIYQTKFNWQPTNEKVFNTPNSGINYMILAGSPQIDSLNGSSMVDKDIELRFLGDSSWALLRRATATLSKWVRVPFTAWQMEHDEANTKGRQVYAVITQQGQDSIWRPATLLDRSYNGQPIKEFYPIQIVVDSLRVGNTYYGGTYYDDITKPVVLGIQAMLWIRSFGNDKGLALYRVFIADIDNDGVAVPKGTVIRFKHYKDVFDGDQKIIIPTKNRQNDLQAQKESVEKINVFPNPYYGVNRAETNASERFVTFSHLPYHVTIRIYNLSGILVKSIQKDNAEQFATWNLNNENNLPVASGLYVAYLELRDQSGNDLGVQKLKIMLVQQQRFNQTR